MGLGSRQTLCIQRYKLEAYVLNTESVSYWHGEAILALPLK